MSGMNGWELRLQRDWRQPAEDLPVAKIALEEYKDEDGYGNKGELRMEVQISPGNFRTYRFKMRHEQYRFFVDEIAARYFAGGP